MEYKIVMCTTDATHVTSNSIDTRFIEVAKLFSEGWVLNPELKPYTTDNAVIYHLIKYTLEELEQMKTEAEQTLKLVSVKSVDINEVDPYLAEGYEVKDFYAKTVTLIKKNKNNKQT